MRVSGLPPAADPFFMSERIQKYLARRGFGSRRSIEKLLAAGHIHSPDGSYALGDRVCPGDIIVIDNQRIEVSAENAAVRVIAYYKKEGQISSHKDPANRPTIVSALPPIETGSWKSVGRLDLNTSGLILFSNDGELVHLLMHPRSAVQREYVCRVQGRPSGADLRCLGSGVANDGEILKFDHVEFIRENRSNSWYRVTLTRGKNREIRRAWDSLGFRVSRLKRIRYGPIDLPRQMKPGDWMELSEAQIEELAHCVSSTAARERSGSSPTE